MTNLPGYLGPILEKLACLFVNTRRTEQRLSDAAHILDLIDQKCPDRALVPVRRRFAHNIVLIFFILRSPQGGLWTLSPVRRLCLDLAGARFSGKFIVSNTGEAYDSHTTSPNRKFLLFTLLPTWKTGRMIPGRRPLESTSPGDKPCCA
jgi:hypothetical protein